MLTFKMEFVFPPGAVARPVPPLPVPGLPYLHVRLLLVPDALRHLILPVSLLSNHGFIYF